MPKGGKRPGAGRPKGSKDRKPAVEAVQKYCRQHRMPEPLEFMCSVMRGIDPRPEDATIDFSTSYTAACKLLNYMYPKLKAIEVNDPETAAKTLELPPLAEADIIRVKTIFDVNF